MNPPVTIVIPCYNAGKWIDVCIQSVLVQDYPNKEVIIVNDGSTDNTVDKASQYGGVKIINFTKNKGEGAACRAGFECAGGEYVCRLSADDYFVVANHLSRQIEAMKRTGADWCYNSMFTTGMDGEPVRVVKTAWIPYPNGRYYNTRQKFDNPILSIPHLTFLFVMMKINPVNSSTLMIRKMAYSKKVFYAGVWRTDWDSQVLMALMVNKAKGIVLNEAGSHYRIHASQESNNPRYQKDMTEIRMRMLEVIDAGDYPVWLKVIGRLMKLWLKTKS
jgi:glycosyltransferase involved in cell wall biosynthesis